MSSQASPSVPGWRLDTVALTLLVGACVVAGCIFSQSDNIFGPGGDWLASSLFESLGVAVYTLLIGWATVVILWLMRNAWWLWSMRVVGWLIALPVTSIIAESIAPNQGGTLGTASLYFLTMTFASPLDLILVGFSAFVALGLIAHRSVKRLTNGVLRTVRTSLRGGMKLLRFLRAGAIRFIQLPRRAFRHWQMKSVRVPVVRSTVVETVIPAPMMVPQEPISVAISSIPIHHHNEPIPTTVTALKLPYELPPLTLLDEPEVFPYELHDEKLRERAALLEKTFADFNLKIKVVGIHTGPVITQYEISLEIGLRVAKVTSLADDLALNLSVPSVRIVAPIPGRNTVGIEVPNEFRATVRIKETILAAQAKTAKCKLPLFLGKDTEGRPLIYDLAEMPHLLIAGRTGTGKSVCLNAVILSLLMTRTPEQVKMILIDPKMLELSEYGRIPHLMHPVVKDMKKAEAILAWAVDKMEERYEILSRARVRNIAGYNDLPRDEVLRRVNPADEEERLRVPEKMPYIVIVVDEMGDLMMSHRKEVEGHIIRLAQKSRAAGIHLIVATQKPTVDVITGLIKSNLPARICFQVSSRTDSMVVLDEKGADKLLGRGDMLFLQPGTSTIIRAQGAYASDEEITRVVSSLECEPEFENELMDLRTMARGEGGILETLGARDPLYVQAIEVVIREQRGSCSLLQRAMGIGYGKAARFIDFMAEDGIVGAYNGSQARQVMYTVEKWEELKVGAV